MVGRLCDVDLDQPDDAALALHLVAGPSDDGGPSAPSFEAFYARHRDGVGRALALTLRDDALAADALDEAMARAYQRWNHVGTMANPAGWVYRVGLNWARSVLRTLSRPGRAPRALEMVSASPTFDADIDRALRQLNVDQRAVVVCRYFIGYSELETADALGIRPGTVKSRLSRALDVLRASAHIRPVGETTETNEEVHP
jgi:RNA polymerase sigma factor (sigma-70 family)